MGTAPLKPFILTGKKHKGIQGKTPGQRNSAPDGFFPGCFGETPSSRRIFCDFRTVVRGTFVLFTEPREYGIPDSKETGSETLTGRGKNGKINHIK